MTPGATSSLNKVKATTRRQAAQLCLNAPCCSLILIAVKILFFTCEKIFEGVYFPPSELLFDYRVDAAG
jgi:hypothetical protein